MRTSSLQQACSLHIRSVAAGTRRARGGAGESVKGGDAGALRSELGGDLGRGGQKDEEHRMGRRGQWP